MPQTTTLADFDWIGTTQRSHPKTTRKTWEHETEERAFLLARLGYPKKHAESRIKASLHWEFDGLGQVAITKRVGALINNAYRRAGVSKKKR